MIDHYQINLPKHLYYKIKRMADARQQALPDLLSDAVDRLDDLDTEYEREIEAMGKEESAFRKLLPDLQANYLNQYVAIYHGEVVDHDPDKTALHKRVDSHFKNKVVLMRQVVEPFEEERIYQFRSPRIIRDKASCLHHFNIVETTYHQHRCWKSA